MTHSNPYSGIPVFTSDFLNPQNTVDSRLTFSRYSSATYFDESGVMAYAAMNGLKYSNDFSHWFFNHILALGSGSVADAINGLSEAIKMTLIVEDTTAAAQHSVYSGTDFSFVAGMEYTASFYVQAKERFRFKVQYYSGRFGSNGTDFNLSTQTVTPSGSTTGAIEHIRDDLYRISITGTCTSAGTGAVTFSMLDAAGNVLYDGDGTSGAYISAAQLNLGDAPQTYYGTTSALYYGPRFDHDLNGSSVGLDIEESSTNYMRNSTMVGAAAGTPGTLPTYWTTYSALTGLTLDVTGVGTEHGMPYVDLHLHGTSSGSGQYSVYMESSSVIMSVLGDPWNFSLFAKLADGSPVNATPRLSIIERAGGAYVTAGTSDPLDVSSTLQRFDFSRTLTGATTDNVLPILRFYIDAADTVDITVRIYQPQMEKRLYVSTPIQTSGASATRAQDKLYSTSIPWFNAVQGSLIIEFDLLALPTASYGYLAAFNSGVSNNLFGMFLDSSGHPVVGQNIGGTIKLSSLGSSLSVGDRARFGISWGGSDGNIGAINGTVLGNGDWSGETLPVGINRLDVGDIIGSGTATLNHHLRKAYGFSYALSSSQLQSMVTL